MGSFFAELSSGPPQQTPGQRSAPATAARNVGARQFIHHGIRLPNLVLLHFSWRIGSKDSRGRGFKGLFSKDFISAFNILSISAMSFLVYPIHLFQLNLNPLLIVSAFPVRKQNHKICIAS